MKQIDVIVGTSLFKFQAHVFKGNKVTIQVDNVLNFFGLSDDGTMTQLLAEGSRYGVMYTEVVSGGPKMFLVPVDSFGKWMSSLAHRITEEGHRNLIFNLTLEAVARIAEETSRAVTIADIWKLENELRYLKSDINQILLNR